jgi:hypothetical protein
MEDSLLLTAKRLRDKQHLRCSLLYWKKKSARAIIAHGRT